MTHAPRVHGWRAFTDERGAALALALVTLVGLSALALGILSISALDPQISRNQAEALRARYLAEGGIEHAFDTLARTVGAWDAYLAGATCTTGVILTESALPGVSPAFGTFTVRVRNDCAVGDERMTAAPRETSVDAAGRDTNGKLVVASTGVVGTTTHTVTAVISYEGLSGQTVSRRRLTTYSWSDL